MAQEKPLTIEDLQAQIEQLKSAKEEEINGLKKQLEQEKLKNAQFSILGMTSQIKKVETQKKDEPVEFDFDL